MSAEFPPATQTPDHRRHAIAFVVLLGLAMLLVWICSFALWANQPRHSIDWRFFVLTLAASSATFVIAILVTWYRMKVAPLSDESIEIARLAAEAAYAESLHQHADRMRLAARASRVALDLRMGRPARQ